MQSGAVATAQPPFAVCQHTPGSLLMHAAAAAASNI